MYFPAGDVEPLGLSVEVDMRLYSDLLDHILVEVVSVPLILHCMLEQVSKIAACHGCTRHDLTVGKTVGNTDL